MVEAKPRNSASVLLEYKEQGILDAYTLIREYILQEDNLIHQRMTWFLTLNSFLFASVALLTNARVGEIGAYSSTDLHLFAALLSVVGIVSARKTQRAIKAAYDAIRALKDHWIVHFEPTDYGIGLSNGMDETIGRVDVSRVFPYVAGGGPYKKTMDRGRTSPIPLVNWTSYVWGAILLYSIFRVIQLNPELTFRASP